jgi:hypothetical protein
MIDRSWLGCTNRYSISEGFGMMNRRWWRSELEGDVRVEGVMQMTGGDLRRTVRDTMGE